MNWFYPLLAASALAIGCSPKPSDPDQGGDTPPAPSDTAPPTEPPALPSNVLLIVLDDVGVDKVGAYDYHPDPARTPTLDALAAGGVLFEQAYAYPLCSPTRSALLTGRHARRTGMGDVADYYSTNYSLPHTEVTIPEVLATRPDLGYTSVAAGKWHLAVEGAPDPLRDALDQGFARYAGTIENLAMRLDGADPEGTYYAWDRNDEGVVAECTVYATTQEIDDALERIEAVPEPWFAYVPLSSAHGPMMAPPESLITVPLPTSPTQVDYVVSMIEAADTEIGRLLASLSPEVLARTTVVVMGDNGTADQAITPPWDPERSKASLYEGGVRVPLIVSGPQVGVPGSRVEAMVHVVDLLPTIAEIAGVDLSAVPGADGSPLVLDGTSFLGTLRDPASPWPRERIYVEKFAPSGAPPYTGTDVRMLRDRDFKVIVNVERGTPEFFQLTPGTVDEGPDLLSSGVPLDAVQQEALDRLLDEIRATTEGMAFAGPPP